MKHLFYILALLLFSCAKESLHNGAVEEGENVAVSFKIDIPEAQLMDSRAVNENQITNLYLLLFDENGRFLSRHQATLVGANFTVTLPQSNKKRTVHFIANHDWTGFVDATLINKDEGELIPPLKSVNLIFWQRVVLTSGINANVFVAQPVSLIRNMAKFSLENRALATLTNVKFALFNTASIGSVAPFNTNTRAFESVVTEPVGATFTDATSFGVTDIYAFERKNSISVANPIYVIVQGTFAGLSYYYKIDIVDSSRNLYDIKRNVWFKIIIESVTMAGYPTLEAAKSSPASNNISASVLLQSYPTISDGAFVLSVDKTVVSFTANQQTLTANCTYKTVGGVPMNTAVVVTLIQDANFPVVNGTVAYNVVTGNLTANIHNVPLNGVSHFATIKLEAGVLSRTIRLRLHAPFNFSNVSVTPNVVGNIIDSPAILKFSVPVEAEYLLPFDCYISSAYLTPVFGNVEVIYKDGIYKYKWRVTAVGEQTINFKTNTANASETLFIEADLFTRAQVAYSNNNSVYRFSNVVITPNRVDFGIGKAVKLKFTVPVAGNYNIYTSNLTPVSGSVVGGVYAYTATAAGEQILNFTTNKLSIAETIRLTGINFMDYTIALKNQLVQISGTLTYGNSNAAINQGQVTVLVGTTVVGIFMTTATGGYQTSIEVKLGDLLTFRFTSGATYSTTVTINSANMVINRKLV